MSLREVTFVFACMASYELFSSFLESLPSRWHAVRRWAWSIIYVALLWVTAIAIAWVF